MLKVDIIHDRCGYYIQGWLVLVGWRLLEVRSSSKCIARVTVFEIAFFILVEDVFFDLSFHDNSADISLSRKFWKKQKLTQ